MTTYAPEVRAPHAWLRKALREHFDAESVRLAGAPVGTLLCILARAPQGLLVRATVVGVTGSIWLPAMEGTARGVARLRNYAQARDLDNTLQNLRRGYPAFHVFAQSFGVPWESDLALLDFSEIE